MKKILKVLIKTLKGDCKQITVNERTKECFSLVGLSTNQNMKKARAFIGYRALF